MGIKEDWDALSEDDKIAVKQQVFTSEESETMGILQSINDNKVELTSDVSKKFHDVMKAKNKPKSRRKAARVGGIAFDHHKI